MLIPCDAPLAEVVSAYLEASDFTSSSRATYRRVLGELAGLGRKWKHGGPQGIRPS